MVILDEVDQLEDSRIIYDLHNLPQFAIICIANKEEELFSRVNERLISRLRSANTSGWTATTTNNILTARVKWSLDQDVITDDQLYRIADAAAGDAHLTIGILQTAASKIDRENNE